MIQSWLSGSLLELTELMPKAVVLHFAALLDAVINVTPQRYQRLRATLDRRQPDLAVMTDHVHKPHNISAILRTCDAVGVQYAHVVMRDNPSFRARSGITKGSERWVDVQLYAQASEALPTLRQQGMKIYAAQLSDRAVDYREVDFTVPCALLMGAEKWGVSDEGAEEADEHIIIPMMGMVESYNVSAATAVILAEAQRQRQLKGFYDQPRLPDAEYQRLLFRWAQPKVAEYCDRHALAYPALTDEGELAEPLPRQI